MSPRKLNTQIAILAVVVFILVAGFLTLDTEPRASTGTTNSQTLCENLWDRLEKVQSEHTLRTQDKTLLTHTINSVIVAGETRANEGTYSGLTLSELRDRLKETEHQLTQLTIQTRAVTDTIDAKCN